MTSSWGSLANFKMRKPTKFWKKRSVTISDLDPQQRVTYLGNVLTGWAKGDGCVDKPLTTLWRNHMSSDKPNIIMKLTVTAQGLKAVTKEHGLTEYWAHRITYCAADPGYPKVFCWIYRHEGRKMKQELRCHAVLCSSEKKAAHMCQRLQERLHQALIEFKKEKISRQNARLNLANSVYENATMPNRKILLHTGSSNYRPPLEKGKSAPKLKVIEEVILEEEEPSSSEEEEDQLEVNNLASAASNNPLEDNQLTRSASSPLVGLTDGDDDDDFAQAAAKLNLRPLDTSEGEAIPLGEINSGSPSFEPLSAEDKRRNSIPVEINERLIARFDEDLEEDEDRITNHLKAGGGASTTENEHPLLEAVNKRIEHENNRRETNSEVDSAASVSPECNSRLSSRSYSSSLSKEKKKGRRRKSSSEEDEDLEAEEVKDLEEDETSPRLASLRIADQDAISDESGYSEESSGLSNPNAAKSNNKRENGSGGGNNTLTRSLSGSGGGNNTLTRSLSAKTPSSNLKVRSDRYSGSKTFVTLNGGAALTTETDCDSVDASSRGGVNHVRTQNHVADASSRGGVNHVRTQNMRTSNHVQNMRTPRDFEHVFSLPPAVNSSPIKDDMTVHSAAIDDFLELKKKSSSQNFNHMTVNNSKSLPATPNLRRVGSANAATQNGGVPHFLPSSAVAEFCINI